MTTIGDNLARFPRIVVPQPIADYSHRARAHDGLHQRAEDHDASVRWCWPKSTSRELAEELFRAYLHQVILDGIFHADPHPGNVLLTDDGRIALLDLGMVSRLSPDLQEELLQLPAGRRRRPDRAARPISRSRMGERLEDFDETGVPPARRAT